MAQNINEVSAEYLISASKAPVQAVIKTLVATEVTPPITTPAKVEDPIAGTICY